MLQRDCNSASSLARGGTSHDAAGEFWRFQTAQKFRKRHAEFWCGHDSFEVRGCQTWRAHSRKDERGHSQRTEFPTSDSFPALFIELKQVTMAAMTMSSVLGSRAALIKPFSAKPSQRRFIVRAEDPNANPDPSVVEGDVISCESLAAPCSNCSQRIARQCSDGSSTGVKLRVLSVSCARLGSCCQGLCMGLLVTLLVLCRRCSCSTGRHWQCIITYARDGRGRECVGREPIRQCLCGVGCMLLESRVLRGCPSVLAVCQESSHQSETCRHRRG